MENHRPASANDAASDSTAASQQPGKEYGEFLHRPGEKFYDFYAIRTEIAARTDVIAGGSKNISMDKISLTIYSPNVVDVVMVDLPGMTKVPVGD